RATARARRCGQAVAGAVLRRSPSAFQRYAESTAGAAGAGRTVDSLQGRRGVLRHPVASRSAGRGAGPTGAAHPAWTAGFHGEGAKGVACSGRGLSSEPRVLDARHPCRSGIGEALVGGLEAKGTPAMVQRVAIAPPQSRVGPLSESERHALIAASPLRGRYDQAIDRESAYEVLAQRAEEAVKEPAVEKTAHKTERAGLGDDLGELAGRA